MSMIVAVETLVKAVMVLWIINQIVPVERSCKIVLSSFVVIAVILWILNISTIPLSFAQFGRGD